MNRLHSNPVCSPSSRNIARRLCCFSLLLIAVLVAGCGSSSTVKVGTVSAIGVQGQATSIVTGGQLALSAVVQNDSKGLGLDWTVTCGVNTTGACGTLNPAHTASGATTNFTAPAAIPASGVLVISVTSTQNPSQSQSITLTMTTTTISVAIDPASALLAVGATQSFAVTVLNDSANAGVNWILTCGSTASEACGTVSAATGASTSYTAPASVPTGGMVTLTAISVTDPAKTASATITVTTIPGGLTVSLSQSATSVAAGATATFTATVLNDPYNAGVTWTVSCVNPGSCGAISPAATMSGASSVFTAPPTVPSSPIVTITATSVTNPNQSASASVQITTGSSGGGGETIGVSVTPPTATVVANGSTTLVAAVANDPSNQGVNWSVTCANPGACGTISPAQTASGATATYMAPLNVPTGGGGVVTVTAASITNPSISASSVITVVATGGGGGSVTVNVSPLAASVAVNASTTLTASVGNDSANAGVTWTVSCPSTGACGSIAPAQTASGASTVYTAPAAIPTGGSVIVTATSVTDSTVSASATITVTPAGGAISVSVTPPTASVVTGATTSLMATVTNDSLNGGVTWTISCASAGACGSVNPTQTASGAAATYTAPAAAPTGSMVTVTATSVTDSSASASAAITVTTPGANITVDLTESATSVVTGGTLTFTAAVANDASNGGVNWSVSCGSQGAGGCGVFSPTTTASGGATTYTAPASAPAGGTVLVTAISVTNPQISSNVSIAVNGTGGPPITVAVTPGTATVAVNATAGLAATVNNDFANAGVSWTVTCASTATGACGSTNPSQTASGVMTTYSAPASVPSGGSVTVTATSITDPTVSASATITVNTTGGAGGITVTVVPSTASLAVGTTAPFTATVLNDNGGTNQVNWTATCSAGACGTFNPATSTSGVHTTYTAPASVPGTGAVTITATSATNNNSSASATVTITAAPSNITVALTTNPPASITTLANVNLTASVTGDTSTTPKIDWSATCGSTATGACGTFVPVQTVTGKGTVYIAPSTVPRGGTVTIVAASDANPAKTATATIDIVALIDISISAQPGANLNIGATTTAQATVANDPANEGVDWSIATCSSAGSPVPAGTDCGSVTSHTSSGSAATYTAPAAAPNGITVSLLAAATASESNALQSVVTANTSAINVAAPLPIAISITNMPPDSVTAGGKAISVGASVDNDSADKGVDWTVTCGSAGACGSFSPAHTADGADSQYTPPAAVPAGATVTLTATATADPTKTASATVTIDAAPVTGNALLNGQYAFVLGGQGGSGFQFAAGSFVADGKGRITSGEEDVSTACTGNSICLTSLQNPNLKAPISGTYTVGNDGRGTITIQASGSANAVLGVNGKQIFKISVVSSSHGFLAEFDANANSAFTTAAATESGSFYLQTPADFAALFTGNYSFILNNSSTLSGSVGPAGGVLSLNAGQVTTTGGEPDLELDFSQGSGVRFPDSLTPESGLGFSKSVDSFGRGQFTLPGQQGDYSLDYYIVDSNHFILFQGDTANALAGSGEGFLQSAANPILNGTYVFTEAASAGGGTVPRAIGGLFSCDQFGNLTGSLDVVLIKESNGVPSFKSATGEAVTGTCGAFDNLGRATLDFSGETLGGLSQLAAYQTADGTLQLVDLSNNFSSGSGIALTQATGISASTFSGNYAANLQGIDAGQSTTFYINNVDTVGQIVADGASALTGTVDVDQYSYSGGALTPGATVSGSFTGNADGRFIGTLNAPPDATNQIFYVVDGGTVLTLRTDGWGGAGILELQTF